jgi:hypothetical protein
MEIDREREFDMAKRKRTVLQRGPLGQLESVFEEEEEADDGIVADGQRVRVPMWAMDALQRDVANHAGQPLVTDGTDNPLALHRPGFRVAADRAQRQAADAALTQAYEEVALRDANAWRTNDENDHPLVSKKRTVPAKQEGDNCSINGRRGRLQLVNGQLECIPDKSVPDQRDAVADAYAAYDQWQQDAWRT